MHTAKGICYFLFAVNAAAIPFNQTLGIEPRNTTLTCTNNQYENGIEISQLKAEGNVHAAPAVDPSVKNQVPASGYPHGYGNRDGITWPNSKCNDEKAQLLEFPVYSDGHLFPYNEKSASLDPGPVRAIFTYPRKDFCGVVTRTDGHFELCV